MSGGLDVLALKEEDVTLFLAANTHLGATNSDFQMEQYISKKKADGWFSIQVFVIILEASNTPWCTLTISCSWWSTGSILPSIAVANREKSG